MELENIFLADMGKKKKKTKCYIFFEPKIGRDFALHSSLDNPSVSTISDVLTGYRLLDIPIPCTKVTEHDILKGLEGFIKHYTVELILDKFKEVEKEATN